MTDQQIGAIQSREGVGAQGQARAQQPGVAGTAPVGQIVEGRGTLSGQPTPAVRNGASTLQGANQHGTSSQGMHAGMSVQQVIIHKLVRGNQGEIELAQIAQQEAKSDKVKQFAQMMIKDHQQALQELQQQQQAMSGDHASTMPMRRMRRLQRVDKPPPGAKQCG